MHSMHSAHRNMVRASSAWRLGRWCPPPSTHGMAPVAIHCNGREGRQCTCVGCESARVQAHQPGSAVGGSNHTASRRPSDSQKPANSAMHPAETTTKPNQLDRVNYYQRAPPECRCRHVPGRPAAAASLALQQQGQRVCGVAGKQHLSNACEQVIQAEAMRLNRAWARSGQLCVTH